MSDVPEIKEIHSRLDDHSKRIQRVEDWQILASRNQQNTTDELQAISRALFGSTDMKETSIKAQLALLTQAVNELVSNKKDWRAFAMQGLFWAATFFVSVLITKFLIP